MTCHDTGPDMTDHAVVTPPDAMTDPVVMHPGPPPGQVMMKDNGTVISPAPLMKGQGMVSCLRPQISSKHFAIQ